jgi:ParB/RepB/Spo0J family partition protein
MTSGTFHHIEITSIAVSREQRQRRDLVAIDELADSIRRLGLIHPIVITRDRVLVAGERRLTACIALGWTAIPAQYTDEVEHHVLRAIELEENIKRRDITWQDQVRSVRDYHQLRGAETPGWSVEDTADAIGLSRPQTGQMLIVAEELLKNNPMITAVPKFSTAEGIVRRARERQDSQMLSKLKETIGVRQDDEEAPPPESIVNVDFKQWVHSHIAPRFNFIHCDFPYGVGSDTFNQGGAAAHGGFEDTKETWESLMETLAEATKKVLTPSAHLMFWFAMRKGDQRLYEPTARALERMGWDINPQPLIWMKSDGAGIIPDPERGPRQIYETCLLGTRGDRKIVRAVSNAYAAPTVREQHMSEKPEPMLRHFFGMLVDENTVILDPTCGSGSALRAAESLGAKYVLGLDISSEFCDRAREALRKARTLKKAEDLVLQFSDGSIPFA